MVVSKIKIKAKYFAFVLVLCSSLHKQVISDCGTPPSITNGVVSSTGPYTPGDTATYTCNAGYALTVATSITCDNSTGTDQWVATLPQCVCNDASCYQTVTVTQTVPVIVTQRYTLYDLPAWTIALMATFGALLFLTLLALIIMLSCCCCRCCPYYMCTSCCGERERHRRSDKEIVDDDFEYYYDVDNGVYVNPHTGAQYYQSPDQGKYLGRFSPSGRDVKNNSDVIHSPNAVNNRNNVFVTDIEKQEKHVPQTVFVNGQASPPPSQVTPSQVVLVDRKLQEQPPKTTQPQYVVIDNSPKVHKQPTKQEPQVVYVTSKRQRDQPTTPKVQPQYVIVSEDGLQTPPTPNRRELQPQIVVINNKPKPEKENPQIVYVSHDGTPQRRRKVSRSASTRVRLPHAVYDDNDEIEQPRRRKVSRSAITGKPPEDYPDYDSEPELMSPKKHQPHVRYKFQSAIERVMGAHKFKKRPVQTPQENWMPHSKPIRGTNGLQYTSTK